MRVLGLVMGLVAALPAQAQWSPVEGGMQHKASGLTCPAPDAGFELKTQVATDKGFSCRYTLRCEGACGGAAGFAAITWNPAMDFDTQFRSLATQQKLAVVDTPGPDWAGLPRLFAREGESFGAWWLVPSRGQPLNIGVFYNIAAEPAAQALVEAAVRLNP